MTRRVESEQLRTQRGIDGADRPAHGDLEQVRDAGEEAVCGLSFVIGREVPVVGVEASTQAVGRVREESDDREAEHRGRVGPPVGARRAGRRTPLRTRSGCLEQRHEVAPSMAAPPGVGQRVQSAASGVLNAAMRARARPPLATLPVLAPVIFAAPVLSGIVATLANLAGTSDPYLGLSTTGTNVDAQAVFLGEPLYGDPDEGYSGLPLSPLFPLVLGALHHVSLWSGWGILISIAAGVSLAAIAAGLGYRSAVAAGAARGAAAAGAVGIGALAWWLITFVPIDFLHEARADQPAWALALGGLVLVPAALDGSRPAAAAAVLMLTAAAWTKQPAGAAMAAAVLWAAVEAGRGRVTWRAAAAFLCALVALNAAILALAVALTSGWAFTFIVEIPTRETREQPLIPSTRELLTSTAGAAIFAATVWAAYLLARRRLPSGRQAQMAGV